MSVDYTQLVQCRRIRASLEPARLAECEEDPALLKEELSVRAKTLLDVAYDAETMAANGCNSVLEWCGHYFARSSDWGYSGPYPTLEDALHEDAFNTPTPNACLRSKRVKVERLLGLARCLVSEVGDVVRINGRPYVWSGDKFQLVVKSRK